MVRRILAGACSLIGATALITASAGAVIPPQGAVGPHQVFGGLVNGQSGYSSPATIRMACFGPIKPGQTGHPFSGQTVEVFRPEVIVGHFGYTGSSANSIVAFFGPPPPTSVTPPTTSTVTFRYYGVVKAIPTSLLLPCSGRGNVYFVPFPMGQPTSTPAVVPVAYVGQP